MATQQEVDNIIDQLIIDNTTRQIDPSKMRQVLKAINERIPASSDPSVLTVSPPLVMDNFTNTIGIPPSNRDDDGFLKNTDFAKFDDAASPVFDSNFKLAAKSPENTDPAMKHVIQINDVCLSFIVSDTPGAGEFGFFQYSDEEKDDQDPTAYTAVLTSLVNVT